MSVSVQDYLDRHKLSIRIEEAVNAAVRAQTEDPVAFIANHLRKHSVAVITKVSARQVLDAQGVPTIQADIHTNRGVFSAIAPTGHSSSIYTANDFRDSNGGSFFSQMGVTKAVVSVLKVLAPMLLGKDPREQADLDKLMATELDHSSERAMPLGANAVRAVSLAICKAGAAEKDMQVHEHIADLAGLPMYSLPAPLFSLIQGGPHVGNGLPFREIFGLPIGAASFSEALQIGVEVSHALVEVTREKFGQEGACFGEGGRFAPPVASTQEALDLILVAAERSGHKSHLRLGLDASARHLYSAADGLYSLGPAPQGAQSNGVAPAKVSSEGLAQLYQELVEEYKLVMVIDPFDMEDFGNTAALTRLVEGSNVKILGGELLGGNVKRIAQAASSKACSGQDLKIPSLGTVTELIGAVRASKDAEWLTLLSCSSGESEDTILADIGVGSGVNCMRIGPVFGAQHTAKYNRALFIEEDQMGQVMYAQPELVLDSSCWPHLDTGAQAH